MFSYSLEDSCKIFETLILGLKCQTKSKRIIITRIITLIMEIIVEFRMRMLLKEDKRVFMLVFLREGLTHTHEH